MNTHYGKCIALAVVCLAPVSVWAGCTSHSTSTHTFTNCSNGTSSISQTIGNNTYTSSSDGSSGTSFRSGNVTYHSNRHGNGTSYHTGRYSQHQWSDGSSGRSRTDGNITVHEWRDPAVGSNQKLGERSPTPVDRARELDDLAERRSIYGHIAGSQ